MAKKTGLAAYYERTQGGTQASPASSQGGGLAAFAQREQAVQQNPEYQAILRQVEEQRKKLQQEAQLGSYYQTQAWAQNALQRQQISAQLGDEQNKLKTLQATYKGLNNGGVGYLSGATRKELLRVQQEMTEQQGIVASLQKQLDDLGINTNENREKKIEDYKDVAGEYYANAFNANWSDPMTAMQNAKRITESWDKKSVKQKELDALEAQMYNDPQDYVTMDRLYDIYGTAATGIGSQITNAGGTALAGISEAEKYRAANPSAGILGERTGPNAPVAGMEGTYAKRAEYAQQENGLDIASAKLEDVADALGETAQIELARAKGGLGTLGQAGVDLAVNALQMGFDVAVGAPLGGASLASMFIRTFGDAAREARLDGADVNHQLAYGLTKAGIEVATEKIFDGLAGAFGKGAADDITEKLIQRLTKDDTGRTLLRAIAGAAGEGVEEVLSDLFGVFADKIYKDGTWSELWHENMDTALYDFLIGAAMGALGGATSIMTGQNAQANERLRTVDRAENMLLQRGYDESNARQYGWMAMQALTGEEMSRADQKRFEGRPTAQAVTTQMANEDTVKVLVGKAKAFQGLTEDQLGIISGGYTEGDPVEYLFGAIDAYELGKTGIELDKAFTLAKDGKTLNAVQFRHAWQLGNSQAQTEEAKTAAEQASLTAEEAMTEEGKAKLAAQLSMFGDQAETVAGAIRQGQDPAQYRTAMNKAAYMIAANGVDVAEYAKNATDDAINSLTPEQIQLAQEIGSQQHMQNQADAKALADRLRGIREKAEADEGYQNLKEIQKALRDMKADRNAEQKAYYDGLAKLQEMNKNGLGETEAYKALQDETQQHKQNVSQIDDVMKMLQDQRGDLKVTPGKVVFAEQDGEAGGVPYKAVDQSKLTRTQKGTLALAEKLAEVAGLEIRVVDMGKGYGGEYIGNGVIYLNINAQFNGKNIAVGSLTHEVTHFLKEYAPEEYALLKDVIIQEIAKDPKAFSSIVSDRLAAQMELTPDALTDEMVANACMTIFQDSDAIKRIVNENRTLAEKIIDFLNEIISNIKAAFSEMNTKDNFTLFKEVRAVENQMEQIRDLWLNAFNEASENRNAEQAIAQAEAENNAPAAAESTTNLQKWEGEEPKKTQYGFKLMNVDENGLPHAMFIDAAKPYELGVWYAADSPKMENLIKLEPGYAYLVDENDVADMATRMPVKKVTRVSKTGKKSTSWQGLPGKKLVNNATAENKRWMIVDQYADGSKSIHNVGINGSDTVSTFALRPGIHAVDIPSMSHIGAKSEGATKIDTRRPNQRWFLIEYPVDQDYNQEAYAHETKDIREHLPERGWYSFQTNSGAEARQHWFITGGMKIVGAVSEADVRKYAKDRGFEEDLPWKMGKAYSEDDAINLEEYMRTTKAMPTPSKEEMRQRIENNRTQTKFQKWDDMTDAERRAEINATMTMQQAKTMLDKAFTVGDVRRYFNGEYKTSDQWLKGEGTEAVAMIIENDYELQRKYINSNEHLVDYDYSIEEVLAAYLDGTLTGKVKPKAARVDTSKSTGYQDNRFYAPQTVQATAETWSKANERVTKSNEADVYAARKAILFAAHEKGIESRLGISASELNKKLRSWSRYSSAARTTSIRINEGVAPENQWTGIQNSAILNGMSITDDDIRSMVKEVKGNSGEYQRKYIGNAMLALDTHIDWSWLSFDFKNGSVDPNRRSVRGNYENSKRKINIGASSGQNTVSHEMGHALDYQWCRELFREASIDPSNPLSQNAFREDLIPDEEGRVFYRNFRSFIDDLMDVNDNYSEYTMTPTEIFARFVDRFVQWTQETAGAYVFKENFGYNDKFSGKHFMEFAKLLQEKSAWDAKQATTPKMQKWDQMTMDDITTGEFSGKIHPTIRAKIEAGEQLRNEVKSYFNLIDGRNSNYLSAEQIDDLMEVDPYGNYQNGDMTGADEVMMALSGFAKNLKASERAGAYELMDKILQHLSPNQKENWISERYGVKDEAFQEWYNKKHPSLYYAGYKPGDLNRYSGRDKEIKHLEKLLRRKTLPAQDRAEAEQFLDELKNRPQRTYYQKWDEDHNEWAPTFYSKMQNVVDDWTNGKGQKLPPKMSAQQVVGWLKGKGVKSEEIRWSGIVPYLEGKKTVTQEELQRVMAENEIRIETKMLEGGEGEGWMWMDDSGYDSYSVNSYDELVEAAKIAAEDNDLNPDSLNWEEDYDGSLTFLAEDEYGYEQTVLTARRAAPKGDTKWSEYILGGGSNYREIMFKMPSLGGYSNPAMRTHWKENDVIAHARVQDMRDTDGNKVLFIEEIQSDLHNEGQKKGYKDSEESLKKIDRFQNRLKKAQEEYNRREQEFRTLAEELDARLDNKKFDHTPQSIFDWITSKELTLIPDRGELWWTISDSDMWEANDAALNAMTDEEIDLFQEAQKTGQELIDAKALYENEVEHNEARLTDVPFAGTSDTYHEYVMKNLLRMAAEGDYDAIGWTTAEMQSDRWSDAYEEGYKIEYDQNIPKFMRKYVRQWGSGVQTIHVNDSTDYLDAWGVPINDAMRQSVLHEGQPLFQRWDETNDDTEAERAARETAYSRLASESAIVEDLLNALETQQTEARAALGELEKKLQLVTTPQVKESSAVKMAGQILQDYNGTVEKAELAAEIKELGDMVLQGASKQALQEKARRIAAEVIDSAEVIEEADAEIYQALHDRIQGAKLTIRPEFLGELNGDFTVLGKKGNRRRNFGPFTLVRTDNTSVDTSQYTSADQFYTDIQAEFPHLLPAPGEDGAKNEGEYVMLLAAMYNAGQGVAANPFEQYMGEATEDLTNRLLMDAMSGVLKPEQGAGAFKARKDALNEQIKQLKKEQKLSDREANNLWNTVYDLSQKLDKAESKYRALQAEADYRLQQVKAEGEARAVALKAHELSEIAALKAHYRDIEKRAKERREESAGFSKYRKQVIEKAGKLYEMMLKNDDKVHVPEVLKQPLGEFLESIDFSSKRSLAGGAETQADQKFGARLMKLQQMLENQQRYLDGDTNAGEDLGGYIDVAPEMMDYLRNMSDLITTAMNTGRTFTVNQMSAEDLKTLSNFLGNLRTAINNMNRFMANARYETVREAAAEDIASMKQLGSVSGAGTTAAAKLATWQNGTPYYIFKRYGKGGEAIFDGLTRGWEKLAFNAREIINFTEDLYTDKEVKEWTSQIHDITLEDGSTIKITTGQIMSLAMLINREQALKHMNKGGARIGDIKQKGLKGTIQDLTQHHFTDTELQKIIGTLTPRQLEVAQKLQKYMATKGAEWGNEISMRRFGYNFYEEGENYFPIRTMPTDRPMADTDAQQNSMFRLLNLSASKSLNPKANNALVIDDIFDVFSDHMADMAKLNGMGLPILDAIKWFNYKEKIKTGEETFTTETMQAAMQTAFGDQAGKYFKTLIKDINGMTESGDRGTNLPTKLLSNYKIAAVAANLRVALLQPTSYVRAMTVLSPKYLIGNIPTKAAYEEALKYSGTAGWKDLGYYETDISRGLREKIKHDDTVRDKIAEASMKPAEFGDQMTWATLWQACKRQAKAQNPDAIGNTLMQKTADLFREVVYSSQVMDSTLTRSEIMRGKTMFTKGMSAFMAEPTLSYNILMDAFSKYNLDARRSGGAVAWQRNSGKIGRALGVYVCSATFAALVESIADAFRDDDDEEFIEKFTQAFFGEDGKILSGNFVQDLSVLGKIPYVKNFISTLQGYRSTDMSVAALTSVMDVFNIWSETIKLANGELDKATKATYYGKMTEWGKIYKTLQALSQLSGFAVSNASRDVIAIWNTIMNGRRDDWKIRTYDGGKGDSEEDKIKSKLLKGKMTEQEAVKALMDTGKNSKVSQTTVDKWQWEQETGVQYSKLDDAYKADEITRGQAIAGMKAAGKSDKDIQKALEDYDFEKKYGTELEGYNLTTAQAKAYYNNGLQNRISLDEYAAQAEEYGTTVIKKYYGGEDKNFDSIEDYATFQSLPIYGDKKGKAAELLKSSGINVKQYASYLESADTDGNGSVKQDELGAVLKSAISRNEITQDEAEKIWYTLWQSKNTYAKWARKH